MTIAQQLIDVNQAKQDIKTAIEAKGVSMTGVTFPNYHTKIAEIQAGSGGTWTPDQVKTWERPTHWPAVVAPTIYDPIKVLTRIDQQDDGHQYENYFQMDVVFDGPCDFQVQWGDGTSSFITTTQVGNEHIGRVDRDFDWNSHPGSPDPVTGYKVSQVAINNIYPFGATANIVKVDFTKYMGNYYTNEIRTKFLEVHINAPYLQDAVFYNGSFNSARHADLEYVNIIQWGPAPSLEQMFYNTCPALARVDLPISTHGGTAVNPKNQPYRMFTGCYSLKEINGFNPTGLDGNMQEWFMECHSLQFIPFDIDFTNFTYSYNAFYGMRSLLEIQSGINIDISNHGYEGIDWGAFYQAEAEYYAIGDFTNPPPQPTDPEFATFFYQDLANFFYNCNSLQAISTLTYRDTITQFYSMFYNCHALLQVPTFVPVGTLTNIGELQSGTIGMGYMFYRCSSLKTIPANMLGKGVEWVGGVNDMFYECRSLQEIHFEWSFFTTGSFNMDRMFQSCHALYLLPNIDTSGAANWNSTFYECFNIVEFPPLWNMHCTQANYIYCEKTFYDCWQMKYMPGDGVIGNSTRHSSSSYGAMDLEQCFYRCYNLEYVGQIFTRTNLYNYPNCQNMFTQCKSLKEVGLIELHHLTGASSTQNYANVNLDYTGSLTYCGIRLPSLTGYPSSFNFLFRNNNLSAANLNNIFNNLQTRTTGTKRIYIGNNPGTATCNTSIATNKGWSVVT